MKTKICSKCGIERDLNYFEKRPDSKDGHRQYCRECKKKQFDVKKIKNTKEENKTFWNLRGCSLNSAKGRRTGVAAKIIQESTPIDGNDLKELYHEQNKKCYYCRTSLSAKDIVFDHKTPLSRCGKHNIDNIAICCSDCNNLKATRTDVEFIEFIEEYIKRFI